MSEAPKGEYYCGNCGAYMTVPATTPHGFSDRPKCPKCKSSMVKVTVK